MSERYETIRARGNLAARGASVLLTDVDEAAGRTVASEAADAGGTVEFVPGDVRDTATWTRWRDAAIKRFGAVHVLVNNAGVFGEDTILSISRARWQRIIDVNLKGCFLGMKTFAPLIKDSGGGSIINVSSGPGSTSTPTPPTPPASGACVA